MNTTRQNYTEEPKPAVAPLNLPNPEITRYGIISRNNSHYSTLVLVQNRYGVHARPAAMAVKIANQYPQCKISAEIGSVKIDATSIMDWLKSEASFGKEVRLIAKGEDCAEVLEKLVVLFNDKFYED